MITVGDICEYIESIAPLEEALDYDNPGLLVGHESAPLERVLTALDLTLDVLKEARDKGCGIVVTHHPIMFKPTQKVTDASVEGQCIIFAIENNIAVYAAHTNLDFAEGGLNDYFIKKLGYTAYGSVKGNEGRYIEANITAADLCGKIASAFGLPCIRTTLREDAKIRHIAVCTGSGKSLIDDVREKSDVYITGELGHHDIARLLEYGCGYIEISHYDSEIIAKDLLKERLDEKYNGKIEVFASEKNADPMRTIIF